MGLLDGLGSTLIEGLLNGIDQLDEPGGGIGVFDVIRDEGLELSVLDKEG